MGRVKEEPGEMLSANTHAHEGDQADGSSGYKVRGVPSP
jgi:hypothetical protein